MLNEFFTWWAEQMLQLVPARLTSQNDAAASALLIEQVDSAPMRVALTSRKNRRDRALGQFDLEAPDLRAIQAAIRNQSGPVILRLPASSLLDREVVLPLAAERDPARVLEYEMDRITPFAASEVFWAYTIQRRDRARGRLHLRLSLIIRETVRPLLTALEQVGIVPTTLEATPGEGGTRRIDLPQAGVRRGRLMRQATPIMAGLCAVLAVAAVALPFVLQSREANHVEARIAALRPQVDAVEAARRRIAASAAGVDVIAAERTRLGDTLAVLAAITDLLPDDTSLTDLTLRQGKLTLNGQGGSAAKLIGALSTDSVIRNPDFSAPVTRVENGHADLFAIRAEVTPIK